MKGTLGPLAHLCIWYYHDKFQEHKLGVTDGYIERMKHSFNKVWCVSAYKGAAQINAHCTPLLNRLKNQSYWLEKALTHDCFEGIILTGWSRFCHQLVLCEILPASMHALAICLKVVKNNDITLRRTYKELVKLGLNGKNVLRSPEQILIEEGKDELLKAKAFNKREESKETDLSWCDNCYEMSWELEKARILYKYIKKEAQQYIHLNYAVESKNNVKKDSTYRKKSYDSICNPLGELHPTSILPKDRRYNIKQRKEVIMTIQQCLSIVTKEEARADTILGKWIYADDLADFKNVRFPLNGIECNI